MSLLEKALREENHELAALPTFYGMLNMINEGKEDVPPGATRTPANTGSTAVSLKKLKSFSFTRHAKLRIYVYHRPSGNKGDYLVEVEGFFFFLTV